MSDTLAKLKLMLVEQLGIPVTEISLDRPLQDIGLDAADLEELKILIEEYFNINVSVIEEEHYEIDVDRPTHNLKDRNLRQLAGWVDDWNSSSKIHPRFHGRLTKPI